MKKVSVIRTILLAGFILTAGCNLANENVKPRLSMFIGVDISGSFKNTRYFHDSLDFLAYYIYAHLNGLGGLDIPNVLFVSSIGGAKANEPKTFYPIQSFENKSVEEIRTKLGEIFPESISNPFTDYNAFFEQVSHIVKSKNLVLRPISIVMLSDGIPDVKKEGGKDFSSIHVEPLERLARNVTIRLLYTNAVVGKDWITKVRRKRVKVWTQDAEVLCSWKDPDIMKPDKQLEEQDYFFAWLRDNVDFGVRSRRID
jgi:hypothetical protein